MLIILYISLAVVCIIGLVTDIRDIFNGEKVLLNIFYALCSLYGAVSLISLVIEGLIS